MSFIPPRYRSRRSASSRKSAASFFGRDVKNAFCVKLFDLAKASDARDDRAVVGQHSAKPAGVDIVLTAALRGFRDRFLSLLLGADKENGAVSGRSLLDKLVRLIEQLQGLVQVDDVDSVASAIDVTLHLRVPATRLVAEVHACFKQVFHC